AGIECAEKRGRNATVAALFIPAAGGGLDSAGGRDHRRRKGPRGSIMSGRAALVCCALAAALAALPAASAGAASWLEMNFYLSGPRYEGVLPPCDYPEVLSRIGRRFTEKEENFWNSELSILAFLKIPNTAFRPWAADTIPRRFCSGIIYVSD